MYGGPTKLQFFFLHFSEISQNKFILTHPTWFSFHAIQGKEKRKLKKKKFPANYDLGCNQIHQKPIHSINSTQFNQLINICIQKEEKKERKITLLRCLEECLSCWYQTQKDCALARIWTPRGSNGRPRWSPRSSSRCWWGWSAWDRGRCRSGRREGRRTGGRRGVIWER